MTIRIVWPVKVNTKHIFYRVSFTGLIILTGFVLGKATNGTVVAPNFTISPNPATVGQTVTFTDMTSVMFDCAPESIIYSWNFGAGATPPSAMQTITDPMDMTIMNAGTAQMVIYSTPGPKTVTLTVTAEDDCDEFVEMVTMTVNISPVPVPTLSQWGLLLLLMLIVILGTIKLKQKYLTSVQ